MRIYLINKKLFLSAAALAVVVTTSAFKPASISTQQIVHVQLTSTNQQQLVDGGYFVYHNIQEYHVFYDSSGNVAAMYESTNGVDGSAVSSFSGHQISINGLSGVEVTFSNGSASFCYKGAVYY